MSLALFKTLLQLSLLQKSSRLALLIYCWHACEFCHRVWISLTSLAREMNCSERNAKKHLAELIKPKLLVFTGEIADKGVKVYRVSLPTPDEIQPVSKPTQKGVSKPTSKGCRFCHPINKSLIDEKEKDESVFVSLKNPNVRVVEEPQSFASILQHIGMTPGSRLWNYLTSDNGGDPHE